jgi:hypothetical protein
MRGYLGRGKRIGGDRFESVRDRDTTRDST